MKLQTPGGIIQGHKLCSEFLEREVKNLLLTDAGLDQAAQDCLLEEVEPCFSEADNSILTAPPTLKCVKKTIESSNLHAAPGSDGLPSLFYKVCWNTMGEPLTDVMKDIFHLQPLTPSLRTSLMVFGTKPKKANILLPTTPRQTQNLFIK